MNTNVVRLFGFLALGVVGSCGSPTAPIATDEKANTIAFGVIDEAARTRLEARLSSLGVSCNLVTTVIQPYPMAL